MKIIIVGKKQQMHWPENVFSCAKRYHNTKLFLYNEWHGISSSIIGHRRNAARLAKLIQHFKPDVILYISCEFIPIEYYQILDKFPQLKRVGWAADNFGYKTPKPRYLDLCCVFDTRCLNVLKHFKCEGAYMPLCADEHTFQYHPYTSKKKPVFVGAANPQRVATLKALKTPCVIWGNNWPVSELKQHEVHNKKVSHKIISSLYEQYLPFNMTYSSNVKNGLNFRIFEIGTTGNVIISNDSKDLPKCYNKSEVLSYHTAKQLDKILSSVIKHPEAYAAIAKKGYKKTMCKHTFDTRVQELFQLIQQKFGL